MRQKKNGGKSVLRRYLLNVSAKEKEKKREKIVKGKQGVGLWLSHKVAAGVFTGSTFFFGICNAFDV